MKGAWEQGYHLSSFCSTYHRIFFRLHDRCVPRGTCIVDLFHARERLHSPIRSLEFRLQDHKDESLAARLEDLGYGYIDGIEARDDLDYPEI